MFMRPRPQLENRDCAECPRRPNLHLAHVWTDITTHDGEPVAIAVFRCVKAPTKHPEVRVTLDPSSLQRG